MHSLKKIRNWFIRKFTNPPKYKELQSHAVGNSPMFEPKDVGGTKASGFNPDSNMLFLHGRIDAVGEQYLNDTLRMYAKLNKTTNIFDFGTKGDLFFTNVYVDDPEIQYGVRYPIFKFFSGELSNSSRLINEAKKYLMSCLVPHAAFKEYYPSIIDARGEYPTFFVATMREELYTPPTLKS